MDSSLGILVWTTFIVGSATVLFLALPDILFWFVGLKEKINGTDRKALEHQAMASPVTQSPDESPVLRPRRRWWS